MASFVLKAGAKLSDLALELRKHDLNRVVTARIKRDGQIKIYVRPRSILRHFRVGANSTAARRAVMLLSAASGSDLAQRHLVAGDDWQLNAMERLNLRVGSLNERLQPFSTVAMTGEGVNDCAGSSENRGERSSSVEHPRVRKSRQVADGGLKKAVRRVGRDTLESAPTAKDAFESAQEVNWTPIKKGAHQTSLASRFYIAEAQRIELLNFLSQIETYKRELRYEGVKGSFVTAKESEVRALAKSLGFDKPTELLKEMSKFNSFVIRCGSSPGAVTKADLVQANRFMRHWQAAAKSEGRLDWIPQHRAVTEFINQVFAPASLPAER